MTRIDVFPHTDLAFVRYLKQVLEERGIDCVVKNDNVAVAGLMERTAQAISPELWVVDDAREAEARRVVEELRQEAPTEDGE